MQRPDVAGPERGRARVYLDHNATAPMREEVLAALADAQRHVYGNASSPHEEGRRARQVLNNARTRIARAIGADRDEVVFTSGATEANQLALIGSLLAAEARHRHALVTAVEHPSVLRPLTEPGLPLDVDTTVLPVSTTGSVDVGELVANVQRETVLVAVQLANNETGTLQPVREIAEQLRERKVTLVCDAVQALGRVPLDVRALGADIVTCSTHKMGGPKGVGFLYKRAGTPWRSFLRGGRQEGEARPGTEDVPSCHAMAVAVELAIADQEAYSHHTAHLRALLVDALRQEFPDLVVHTPLRDSIPNSLSVAFPGVNAIALVAFLDLNGISVSTGSACATASREPSHVIRAIGRGALAPSTLRLSFGKANQVNEIDRLLAALKRAPGLRHLAT
ncbi:MAG: cysteine desulfurase family protein [Planctomycetota bacterium]